MHRTLQKKWLNVLIDNEIVEMTQGEVTEEKNSVWHKKSHPIFESIQEDWGGIAMH